MQRSRIANPQLSRGFAAMALPLERASQPSANSANQQQGSDHSQGQSAADHATDNLFVHQAPSDHQSASRYLPPDVAASHQHGRCRYDLLHQQSDRLQQPHGEVRGDLIYQQSDVASHQRGEVGSGMIHQQSDELQQRQPARRGSLRRALSGNWAPGNVLRRIVGNARRNHHDPLARSSSSNAGRVASRTDLADASAMPNAK